MTKSVGWGWEVVNINNAGEDAVLPVVNAITLKNISVDVAFMPTQAPGVFSGGGWAEVLCQGFVLPAPPPAPVKGPAYENAPLSPDFGAPQTQNPNGFNSGASAAVVDGQLFAVILKTWIPAGSAAGSATSRNVNIPLDFAVPAGAVIALHMDHMGVAGDVEMQLTLQY